MKQDSQAFRSEGKQIGTKELCSLVYHGEASQYAPSQEGPGLHAGPPLAAATHSEGEEAAAACGQTRPPEHPALTRRHACRAP